MARNIADWLAKLDLGRHAGVFADQGIDFDVLGELSDGDLEKLGVVLGDRRRILRANAEQRGGAPPPPQPEAERRQHGDVLRSRGVDGDLGAARSRGHAREVIRLYQDSCAGIAAGYDGFVAKFMGDGVLVFFGYPRAHEDDWRQVASCRCSPRCCRSRMPNATHRSGSAPSSIAARPDAADCRG